MAEPLVSNVEVGTLGEPCASPSAPSRAPSRKQFLLAASVLTVVIVGCSVYANLAFAVTNPVNLRYFPPFEPHVNANLNRHLGHEYFNIARSLWAGNGFANPFSQPTGPTAWMPPVLPTLLAGLLWLCDGNAEAVLAIVIVLKGFVLIGTGLLVLALAPVQSRSRVGVVFATAIYIIGVLCHFRQCFQFANDSWLLLLAMDVLVAWLCWFPPRTAVAVIAWGVFGGLCALMSPVLGITWGMSSLLDGWRRTCWRHAWPRLALAVVAASLTLAPWAIRNYLLFGRWIPVKSNLAYELYQSQCMQADGLLQTHTVRQHPNTTSGREWLEFKTLGEIAYLDRKGEQFRQSVWADPGDYLDRVAYRFLGVTLWHVPFNRVLEAKHPWVLWGNRVTHPLPFIAIVILVFTSLARPLERAQWIVIAVYWYYLLPYIGASFYERYAFPVMAVKVLLVIWAIERMLPRPWPASRAALAAGWLCREAGRSNPAANAARLAGRDPRIPDARHPKPALSWFDIACWRMDRVRRTCHWWGRPLPGCSGRRDVPRSQRSTVAGSVRR